MPLKLSRRRRHIIGTAGAFVFLAIAAGILIPQLTEQRAGYVPGGEVEGLTTGLSRDLPGEHPDVSFTDVTQAADIGFRHFPARRTGQIPEDMGSGVAWADYDNDGWLDLFLVDIARPLQIETEVDEAPRRSREQGSSRLYRNLGNGSFRDVTSQAGINHQAIGMGVSWADYNNDGWTDLFLTSFGDNVLYQNLGDGTFRDASRDAGMEGHPGFWAGASWSDYDLDGHLDLYVTGYVAYDTLRNLGGVELQYDVEIPASLNPSSFPPHRNLLWHNDGNGTFSEIAEAAGVLGDRGRSLGAVWADFDEDGWPDLYVANDVSDNALYRNLGDGTFTDVSHRAAVSDYRGAMGLALGDWDGDEDLDLFITHWIAQENALFSNLTADLTATPGEPKSLRFVDQADRRGLGQVALDFIGWGTSFFDYDNDGRLDLFVANGSTFQLEDQAHLLVPMRDQLFWNRNGEEGFFDVSSVAGDHFARELVGRGAAFGDFDRDGDVDVVVVNHGSTPVLLRNDGGNRGAWIQVRLQGTQSNRSAIGARVRIVAGEAVQTRVVGAQPSYLSHNSLVQHFGLGDDSQVDTVEVLWAGGRREIWTDIPGQQAIRLVEGDPEWREEWKPVSRETSQRFWEHYRAAGRHRIHGDLEESAVEYELALALDPVHEDALYYLGSVQLTMGRFTDSERTLEQLIALNPQSTRALTQLGVVNACPDPGGPLDLQRAGWALESAWEINREQTGTPLWLGLVALLRDDLPGAREHFQFVLGSNPRSVPATYLLGYIDWTQGQTDAANEELAAAIEFAIPPGNSDAGLLEGDTRNSRPLFAAAMSCHWLEDQLAGLAHRDRDSRLTVEAQYAALQNALEQAKYRIPN